MNIRNHFTLEKWGVFKICALARLVCFSSTNPRPSPTSFRAQSGPKQHLVCEQTFSEDSVAWSQLESWMLPQDLLVCGEENVHARCCQTASENRQSSASKHVLYESVCGCLRKNVQEAECGERLALVITVPRWDYIGSLRAPGALEMLKAQISAKISQ